MNQDKLAALKALAAKLDETIVDKDAKDHFLKLQRIGWTMWKGK